MEDLKMKISVITPTGGRSLAFELCELCMSKQTIQPYEWIVVDDYIVPTQCTMGQKVIRRQPFWKTGQMTLQKNLLEALKVVTGDIIFIIEDDDWYSPNYIENMVKKIETLSEGKPIGNSSLLIGEGVSLYYNIRNYTYYYFNNMSYSSLFQTAFTKDLIPQINNLLIKYIDHLYFDGCLWKDLENCNKIVFLTKSPWSMGIKGLHAKRTAKTFGYLGELPFLDEKYFFLPQKIMGEQYANIYMYISEQSNLREYTRTNEILLEEINQVDQNLSKLNKKNIE